MSDLFGRYFLVLSGRVSEADCGVLVSLPTPISGDLFLGWPPESPLKPNKSANGCEPTETELTSPQAP